MRYTGDDYVALIPAVRSRGFIEALNWTESPIERLFLAVLIAGSEPKLRWGRPSQSALAGLGIESAKGAVVTDDDKFVVLVQPTIVVDRMRIRLDFAMAFSDWAYRVAVELDGHEFHERTREQAERDKHRDRTLVSNGWRVIRFTGSEVVRNVSKCVVEATTASPRARTAGASGGRNQ